MGRVRTKQVKRIGREIFEKYRDMITEDWELNKQRLRPLLFSPSKRLKNKIIGYVTKLAKMEKKNEKRGE